MTSKDYKLLAKWAATANISSSQVAVLLAHLAQDNPRFDADKFLSSLEDCRDIAKLEAVA